MASDNILVAIKSRPFSSREKTEKLKSQWVIQQDAIYQIDDECHRSGEPYTFDHIFHETSSNEDVYNTVVEPLVMSCLKGFNSTIFAYGQTSSGKTYTMLGNNYNPGIIQHAVEDIFKYLEECTLRRYLIRCSYFEIYREKINDLFDKNGQDLKIREDICGNTFVNARQEVVSKAEHVFDLMKVGNKIKKIGYTNMNERSSRSHTIFRFTIESTENGIANGPVQISQLNLVDLAGSERISHTKVVGVRLDEGININKSLSALGNVIRQLSDGEGFISYRDSKLTRLLQQALGGNAKALIIATVTLAVGEETKSTLEFAQRAKIVKNRPIINEILTEQDKLKQYELVTADYKERLEKETLRIQEMELEKEAREKEISKLKENFKLINTFLKGKEVKNQSKIPRRHTVGHYSSQPLLEPIPEISTPSTSKNIQPTINVSVEEDCPQGAPEALDDFQELLEDSTLNTSYELLQKRVHHLEDSLTSLREFTKLEVEFKDCGIVEELKKEKENLVKDLADYNILIIEERRKSHALIMQLEQEVKSLKTQLQLQKNINKDSQFALEQANAEMAALTELEGQNSEFVFEPQDFRFGEDQKESDDEETNSYSNREMCAEINNLKDESHELRETLDNVHKKYLEELSQLQNKYDSLQRQRNEEDADILSKLYYLKDILEVNGDVQNDLDEKHTRDMLEAEIATIKNEKTLMETENNELVKSIHQLQDCIENLEIKNSGLQIEVQNQVKNMSSLETTINSNTAENNRLMTELKEIKEEKNRLMTELEEINKEKNGLMALLEEIKEENKIIYNQNFELENNVQNLKQKYNGMENYNFDLLMKISDLEEESKAALEENEKQYLKMQTENELKEECNKKLLQEAKELTSECENLKKKLRDILIEKIVVMSENDNLKKQIDLLNTNTADLKENYEELTLDLQKYREKVDRLKILTQRYRENLLALHAVKHHSPPKEHEDDAGSSIAKHNTSCTDELEDIVQGGQLLDEVVALTSQNVQLKEELDALKIGAFGNSYVVFRNRKLEDMILGFKTRIEAIEKLASSTCRLVSSLSPREMRRRKRQSIHDERRNIEATGQVEEKMGSNCLLEIDEILIRLETEIRALISQREDELKYFKQQVEELKSKIQSCPNCKLKDMQIAHLEDLQNKNVTKIEELEMTICDLRIVHKIKIDSEAQKLQYMEDCVTDLEARLETLESVETRTVEVQCEIQSKDLDCLNGKLEHLTAENEFLESEAQGFIRELTDMNKYYEEQKVEIQLLTETIEKMNEKALKCLACETMKNRLEEVQTSERNNIFKLVGMETKMYDLNNKHKVEIANIQEKCEFFQNRIQDLESKLKKKTSTKSIQCDLMDYGHLQEKYINMKKLALIRRNEGNKLRARLGLLPDEPVP